MRLNPTDHPAGSRVLCEAGRLRSSHLYEMNVIEWSPGGRAKVKFLHTFNGTWLDQESLPNVVEHLGVAK